MNACMTIVAFLGEALLAVVTEITVHEAARDRADRLRRVLSYAWYHRFEGSKYCYKLMPHLLVVTNTCSLAQSLF